MTIWIFVVAITAIACATLYYGAARRPVNAGTDATTSHFRAQLGEIEADAAAGRLGAAEAVAAKGELARELIRSQGEAARAVPAAIGRLGIALPLLAIAALSIGTYWMLGRPDMPAQPLAGRDAQAETALDLDAAIKTIEARLTQNPDDVRGWQVIAPAYQQLDRFADAVRAYRRINELTGPTADTETDLGEALVILNEGSAEGEALTLFRSAAARDASHIRSRFYIAGEETRAGHYEAAVAEWNALLALAKGNEPWVVTARDGLAFAEAALNPATPSAEPGDAQIDAMVDGLDARLRTQGGSIDEWTQLVRSRMVQGRMDDAQLAYDAARKAYPDALMRIELDVLAADNGLVAQAAP